MPILNESTSHITSQLFTLSTDNESSPRTIPHVQHVSTSASPSSSPLPALTAAHRKKRTLEEAVFAIAESCKRQNTGDEANNGAMLQLLTSMYQQQQQFQLQLMQMQQQSQQQQQEFFIQALKDLKSK